MAQSEAFAGLDRQGQEQGPQQVLSGSLSSFPGNTNSLDCAPQDAEVRPHVPPQEAVEEPNGFHASVVLRQDSSEPSASPILETGQPAAPVVFKELRVPSQPHQQQPRQSCSSLSYSMDSFLAVTSQKKKSTSSEGVEAGSKEDEKSREEEEVAERQEVSTTVVAPLAHSLQGEGDANVQAFQYSRRLSTQGGALVNRSPDGTQPPSSSRITCTVVCGGSRGGGGSVVRHVSRDGDGESRSPIATAVELLGRVPTVSSISVPPVWPPNKTHLPAPMHFSASVVASAARSLCSEASHTGGKNPSMNVNSPLPPPSTVVECPRTLSPVPLPLPVPLTERSGVQSQAQTPRDKVAEQTTPQQRGGGSCFPPLTTASGCVLPHPNSLWPPPSFSPSPTPRTNPLNNPAPPPITRAQTCTAHVPREFPAPGIVPRQATTVGRQSVPPASALGDKIPIMPLPQRASFHFIPPTRLSLPPSHGGAAFHPPTTGIPQGARTTVPLPLHVPRQPHANRSSVVPPTPHPSAHCTAGHSIRFALSCHKPSSRQKKMPQTAEKGGKGTAPILRLQTHPATPVCLPPHHPLPPHISGSHVVNRMHTYSVPPPPMHPSLPAHLMPPMPTHRSFIHYPDEKNLVPSTAPPSFREHNLPANSPRIVLFGTSAQKQQQQCTMHVCPPVSQSLIPFPSAPPGGHLSLVGQSQSAFNHQTLFLTPRPSNLPANRQTVPAPAVSASPLSVSAVSPLNGDGLLRGRLVKKSGGAGGMSDVPSEMDGESECVPSASTINNQCVIVQRGASKKTNSPPVPPLRLHVLRKGLAVKDTGDPLQGPLEDNMNLPRRVSVTAREARAATRPDPQVMRKYGIDPPMQTHRPVPFYDHGHPVPVGRDLNRGGDPSHEIRRRNDYIGTGARARGGGKRTMGAATHRPSSPPSAASAAAQIGRVGPSVGMVRSHRGKDLGATGRMNAAKGGARQSQWHSELDRLKRRQKEVQERLRIPSEGLSSSPVQTSRQTNREWPIPVQGQDKENKGKSGIASVSQRFTRLKAGRPGRVEEGGNDPSAPPPLETSEDQKGTADPNQPGQGSPHATGVTNLWPISRRLQRFVTADTKRPAGERAGLGVPSSTRTAKEKGRPGAQMTDTGGTRGGMKGIGKSISSGAREGTQMIGKREEKGVAAQRIVKSKPPGASRAEEAVSATAAAARTPRLKTSPEVPVSFSSRDGGGTRSVHPKGPGAHAVGEEKFMMGKGPLAPHLEHEREQETITSAVSDKEVDVKVRAAAEGVRKVSEAKKFISRALAGREKGGVSEGSRKYQAGASSRVGGAEGGMGGRFQKEQVSAGPRNPALLQDGVQHSAATPSLLSTSRQSDQRGGAATIGKRVQAEGGRRARPLEPVSSASATRTEQNGGPQTGPSSGAAKGLSRDVRGQQNTQPISPKSALRKENLQVSRTRESEVLRAVGRGERVRVSASGRKPVSQARGDRDSGLSQCRPSEGAVTQEGPLSMACASVLANIERFREEIERAQRGSASESEGGRGVSRGSEALGGHAVDPDNRISFTGAVAVDCDGGFPFPSSTSGGRLAHLIKKGGRRVLRVESALHMHLHTDAMGQSGEGRTQTASSLPLVPPSAPSATAEESCEGRGGGSQEGVCRANLQTGSERDQVATVQEEKGRGQEDGARQGEGEGEDQEDEEVPPDERESEVDESASACSPRWSVGLETIPE
uniref:Uncharacterized protein n=1 Tax=Chromera velia CCMP2878 TaxID=1169474 RepID=A0A0G4I2E0_9ALVE|eukprot:Cvel_10372.t1-p1 / transcript=Cvel_10372.t1 / gene=Cvel_10372 / organism=Chromera_velia_CCMP2878 / gene_product=hypothetical protein / transcript_product=hypothetical protein / location=Cvel_scaffold624:60513-66828(-) / protein_length=1705 / sequence_SO=supercontig / SO=protein_coding / is_pseudo=false